VARRIRNSDLETRTARLRLPITTKPVFVKMGRGLALGYRRNTAAGTWVVRDTRGGRDRMTTIGTADDYDDENGRTVLDYWQAQDKARGIARSNPSRDESDDADRLPTVAESLDRYESDLKIRGGDAGNVGRVRGHLPRALGQKAVALVKARELRSWRDELAKTLAPATVNRIANALRAALNLTAEHDDRITSRRAWESGLMAIPDAEESRNVVLTENAVLAIIDQSYADDYDGEAFGMLVETAAVTGNRYSQIYRLSVQDLQDGRADPRLMMPSSRKGRGKKTITRRPVPITQGLAEKLRVAASGRPSTAPLLIRKNSSPWKKSDHSRPFARAVKAAGLNADAITIYALRHTNIVRQLLANVPVRVVAANHDTSVTMIEKTYSRYISDHSDTLIRRTLLDRAAPTDPNVIPLPVDKKQA
jgi:integrase